MKTKEIRRSVFSFFKEIIIVLIGVIIALIINDWKEEANNSKYIKSVLSAVKNDIELSQTSTEETMAKHLEVIDSIAFDIKNNKETQSLRTILEKIGGVQYPAIKNVSLEYLSSNKAELVDYEFISIISDIETNTTFLEKKFDKLLDFVYEKMEEKDNDNKTMFAIHLTNVIDSEATLLELYDAFLNMQQIDN